ncbi:MAG TPA: glycosyltransferase family 39 protein [Candidatus Limnocylindrales bacterium]|nr:glycosyltransferase family 39 protein [Candidatus Limnocylindrales bacterium]
MRGERSGSLWVGYPLGLLAAFVLGVVLRAGPVMGHGWPLQDGGLFYRMIGEIVQSGLRLPQMTTYDRANIPFAYPPLALWIAAATESLTSAARSDVMRVLPLLFSILTLPATYLLARDLLPSRSAAAVAVLAVAVEPYAYQYQITGGGLTRSAGMLLGILAVWQGLRLLRRPNSWHVIATAVLGGAAALSHPEAGVFVAVALGLGWLCFKPSPMGAIRLIAAAAGAALVSAPWWLIVILRSGPQPLMAALTGTSHDPVASLVTFFFVYLAQGPLPVLAILAILGAAWAIRRRELYLIVWWAGICLADLRYAPVAGTVPLSLLAGLGLVEVVGPAADRLGLRSATPGRRTLAGGTATAVVLLVVAVGLVQDVAWFSPGVALTPADRAAMAWVTGQQPTRRSFAVLGGPQWGSDDVAEWFPALTDRASLTTSQGFEWLGGAVRAHEHDAEVALRACQPQVANGCLGSWLETYAEPSADWAIYVAADGSMYAQPGSDCCAAARAWVRADPDLRVVYDGPGALIAVPAGSIAAGATSPAR